MSALPPSMVSRVQTAMAPSLHLGPSGTLSSWLGPAEQLGGAQPTLASDQDTVGPDDNRLQQAELIDAGGERSEIAEVFAETRADDDLVNGPQRLGLGVIRLSDGWNILRLSARRRISRGGSLLIPLLRLGGRGV